MNSLDRSRGTIRTLLNVFHLATFTWLVSLRYGLGFAAARRAFMNAGLGRGKSDIFRSLDLGLAGPTCASDRTRSLESKLRRFGYACRDNHHRFR